MKRSVFILQGDTIFDLPDQMNTPVEHGIKILFRDLEKVFGKTPHLGKNSDGGGVNIRMASSHDPIIDKPESFMIHFEETNNGFWNMNLIGNDDLGLVYGLLYISQKYLGVDPFWFWNDQEPSKRQLIEIPVTDFLAPEPKVRFRGWFINDEVLLTGWKEDPFAAEVWQPVFETLLRCGGNMVIPGTDTNSKVNRKLAAEMGLWITHHHAEPLGAELFLRAFPDREPRYDQNRDLFEKLWREAVIAQKEQKVIWTLGFRGQGDNAFWDFDPTYQTPESRGKLISKVIQTQYDIVNEYVSNPVFCTNLYGEIMELYQQGYLKLPVGVIKIWADSGYGKMVSRRQHNHNPRLYSLPGKQDQGPHGVYYHVTFYDLQASNHLTMLPNSPELVNDELTAAFEAGADQYLLVNCGNIKPHTFLLDLTRKIWNRGSMDLNEHYRDYMERFFPSAPQLVADCFRKYFEASVQYGPYPDEKVGEQFYHHPARIMICHWLRPDNHATEESMSWATGTVPFKEQFLWYRQKLESSVKNWYELKKECLDTLPRLPQQEQELFFDTLLVQVILHLSGCKGGIKLCQSYEAYLQGDYPLAFTYAVAAQKEYLEGVKAISQVEHGKWRDFYRNDCLTNVKLTCYCLDTLSKYLRALGDGPNFFRWEKQFLLPETEKELFTESTSTSQLTDAELGEKLINLFRVY